jgi:hypothetical protein
MKTKSTTKLKPTKWFGIDSFEHHFDTENVHIAISGETNPYELTLELHGKKFDVITALDGVVTLKASGDLALELAAALADITRVIKVVKSC